MFGLRPRRPRGEAADDLRLHVGCGQAALPGWLNIDNQALPGVDRVLDVRDGLPFTNVQAIFAEHFLEHLTLEEGLAFLRHARRALAPDGILRLSTPNLDWVYLTNYRADATASELESSRLCLQINRAFHGWGHRFLYNGPMLLAALKAAGFAAFTFCRYGESSVPYLQNLERHARSDDVPENPHVLIVEASGQAKPVPFPKEMLEEYRAAIESR